MVQDHFCKKETLEAGNGPRNGEDGGNGEIGNIGRFRF